MSTSFPLRRRFRVLQLLCCLSLLSTAAFADDFVVVRNVKSGKSAMTKAELRAVFSGKQRTWADGEAVVVVLQPASSPAFAWLAERIFGLGPRALALKIKRAVFKDDMNSPVETKREADVLDELKEHAGAVGVVSSATVLPPELGPVELR